LRLVARTGRDLNEAHPPQYPADTSFIHGDGEFPPDPVPQIDQPPAHDVMDRWDRPALNNRRQGLALRCVELGGIARRRAVNQPRRTIRIETQDPITDHLKLGRSNPGRIPAPSTIINNRQRQQATALGRILAPLGNPPQIRSIVIFPQSNRRTHDDLPKRFTIIDSEIVTHGNLKVSLGYGSLV
jgi:hypothetical protein